MVFTVCLGNFALALKTNLGQVIKGFQVWVTILDGMV